MANPSQPLESMRAHPGARRHNKEFRYDLGEKGFCANSTGERRQSRSHPSCICSLRSVDRTICRKHGTPVWTLGVFFAHGSGGASIQGLLATRFALRRPVGGGLFATRQPGNDRDRRDRRRSGRYNGEPAPGLSDTSQQAPRSCIHLHS